MADVDTVRFQSNPAQPYSHSVVIPAGKRLFMTCGVVPQKQTVTQPSAAHNSYGDTHTQALSVLRTIESLLKAQSISMSHVVHLRAYLIPDARSQGRVDFDGYFRAYKAYFDNAENPHKPARATLVLPALVDPEWLIEIEAVAAFP